MEIIKGAYFLWTHDNSFREKSKWKINKKEEIHDKKERKNAQKKVWKVCKKCDEKGNADNGVNLRWKKCGNPKKDKKKRLDKEQFYKTQNFSWKKYQIESNKDENME